MLDLFMPGHKPPSVRCYPNNNNRQINTDIPTEHRITRLGTLHNNLHQAINQHGNKAGNLITDQLLEPSSKRVLIQHNHQIHDPVNFTNLSKNLRQFIFQPTQLTVFGSNLFCGDTLCD
jgi:hypothetical protein